MPSSGILKRGGDVTMHPEKLHRSPPNASGKNVTYRRRYGAVRRTYLLPPRTLSRRHPTRYEHRRAASRSQRSPLRSIRTANSSERRRRSPTARFFGYKKGIFLVRALFARRPASRSARSATPKPAPLFLALSSLRREKGVRSYLPPSSVLDSRSLRTFLRASDEKRG